jgi:hypothetical protein
LAGAESGPVGDCGRIGFLGGLKDTDTDDWVFFEQIAEEFFSTLDVWFDIEHFGCFTAGG